MSAVYDYTIVVGSVLVDGPGPAQGEGAAALLAEAGSALRAGGQPDWTGLTAELQRVTDATSATRQALGERAAKESAEVRRSEAPDSFDDTTAYDRYFRVDRVADWTCDERVAAAAPALTALVGDLPSVGLPDGDKATLLEFGARVMAAQRAPAPARGSAVEPIPTPSRLGPLERWRLGHHLFALANRDLATELTRFAEAMERPAALGGRELTGAQAQLRSVTASMEYASALSSAQYVAQVRPTMEPPHTDVELSGKMNRDYSASKRALSNLLDGALAAHDAGSLRNLDVGLGRAVEELLSLDLLDFERHIALAHRLVGVLPALDTNDGSAVHDLRALYLRRLVRYLPFVSTSGHLRAALDLPASEAAT